jgi:hypothetical protein
LLVWIKSYKNMIIYKNITLEGLPIDVILIIPILKHFWYHHFIQESNTSKTFNINIYQLPLALICSLIDFKRLRTSIWTLNHKLLPTTKQCATKHTQHICSIIMFKFPKWTCNFTRYCYWKLWYLFWHKTLIIPTNPPRKKNPINKYMYSLKHYVKIKLIKILKENDLDCGNNVNDIMNY